MPPIGRRNKDTLFGNAQQFPQKSDLTLEAHTSFKQLVTGQPVDSFVVKRQLDIFRHGLTVGRIELEAAMGVFACIGLLATTEVDEGFINALPSSLTCAFYHF
jgi:hypothetical protein